MIGKLLNRNLSVPVEAEVSTQGIGPKEENSIGDSEKLSCQQLGIANTPDRFEEARKNDSDLSKILDSLDDKSISTPYPGEEWFWQTPDSEQVRLTVDQFEMDHLGHLIIKNIES